jgi:hypothetical protein
VVLHLEQLHGLLLVLVQFVQGLGFHLLHRVELARGDVLGLVDLRVLLA